MFWELVSSSPDVDYKIFKTRIDVSRSPRTGEAHRFVVLDGPNWVNVIARTTDGKFVMVRQIRHGIRELTVEIPGGMLDGDEHPAVAGERELVEETGYKPARMLELGWVHPNPAIQVNRCYVYLAEDCEPVAGLNLDPGEDIQVELWTLEDIERAILSAEITHALVIAAFYFYAKTRS